MLKHVSLFLLAVDADVPALLFIDRVLESEYSVLYAWVLSKKSTFFLKYQ